MRKTMSGRSKVSQNFKKAKEIKLNLMQAAVVKAITQYKIPNITVKAGRGAGKSFILGYALSMAVINMPRSTGVIVGETFVQIKSRTLPSTKEGLEKMGFFEGIDYVVGKSGKSLGFNMPFQAPDSWANVIHFRNGAIAVMVSLDNPNSGRGLNAYWVIGDEAALLNYERLFNNVLTTNRAVKPEFEGKPMLHSNIFVTSVPMTQKGKWIHDRETLAKAEKDNNIPLNEREYLFIKAPSMINSENLKKGYVEKMRKESLSRIAFEAEILNIDPKGVEDGFYPQLKQRHYYQYKDDLSILGGVTENYTPSCKYDQDLVRNVPLDFNLDFGGKINCGTVSQYLKLDNQINFIKEFYAKSVDGEKLSDLVQKFIEYYEPHKASCNIVNLYHDRSGFKEEANSKTTLAEDVENQLRKAGWRVINRTPNTNNPGHIVKYRLIETILSETDHELPTVRINQDRCPNLIISLENAAVTHKKDGYEKDKSSEKSKTIPQEHATHFSDTFDYRLFWGFADIIDNTYTQSMVITNL